VWFWNYYGFHPIVSYREPEHLRLIFRSYVVYPFGLDGSDVE